MLTHFFLCRHLNNQTGQWAITIYSIRYGVWSVFGQSCQKQYVPVYTAPICGQWLHMLTSRKTVILGTNATIEGFFWFSIALVKFLIRIQICDWHSQTWWKTSHQFIEWFVPKVKIFQTKFSNQMTLLKICISKDKSPKIYFITKLYSCLKRTTYAAIACISIKSRLKAI